MPDARTARDLFAAFQKFALARDGASFGDLFAEDGTMEFPLVPGGNPLRFEGRVAVRARAIEAWSTMQLRLEAFDDVVVHEGADGDSLVAEYLLRGTIVATNAPFTVTGVLVLREKNGQIASMREYLDPVALAKARVPTAADPAERSPRAVLRLVHQAMKDTSANALADLYAADGLHEFPFFVPNRPSRIQGRASIRESYREGWKNHPLDIESIEDVFVRDVLGDPEIVIGQWRGHATVRATGNAVVLTGLLVLRVRKGLIVHTLDFMDALGIANALGRQPFAPHAEAERTLSSVTPKAMFLKVIDCMRRDDREAQLQLYAADCIFEFPFANDRPRHIEGRDAFARIMTTLWEQARTRGARVTGAEYTLIDAADPELLVVELLLQVEAAGASATLPFVQILRVRENQIVQLREYANPPARSELLR